MADSLVLTGVKGVKKHAGSELRLTRPKRGGDTHSVKKWWCGAGASTVYAECAVFDVTVGNNTCKLAVNASAGSHVTILHDGAFGFTFRGIHGIKRAALFTSDYQLIEHYVFPAISGGKVMTVTPAGSAERPGASAPEPVVFAAPVVEEPVVEDEPVVEEEEVIEEEVVEEEEES